jgi:hypothetical protein
MQPASRPSSCVCRTVSPGLFDAPSSGLERRGGLMLRYLIAAGGFAVGGISGSAVHDNQI